MISATTACFVLVFSVSFCFHLLQLQGKAESGKPTPALALGLEEILLSDDAKASRFILTAGEGIRLHYSCYKDRTEWDKNRRRQSAHTSVCVVVCAWASRDGLRGLILLCSRCKPLPLAAVLELALQTLTLATLQKQTDQAVAMVVDKAHDGVYGKFEATGADLGGIRQTMRAILGGAATCSKCGQAATHICGSTEKAVFLCENCATTDHGGCSNVVSLKELEVAVNEARPVSLRPDPVLLVGARFVAKKKLAHAATTEWSVDSVKTEEPDWTKWTARLSVAYGPSKIFTKSITLVALERDYKATAQAVFQERYFAVCRSWMVTYETKRLPLYGLMAPGSVVERLPQEDVDAVRQCLKTGKIDEIMERLVQRRLPMRWLPHLATAPASGAAPVHYAAPQPESTRKRKSGMRIPSVVLACLSYLRL